MTMTLSEAQLAIARRAFAVPSLLTPEIEAAIAAEMKAEAFKAGHAPRAYVYKVDMTGVWAARDAMLLDLIRKGYDRAGELARMSGVGENEIRQSIVRMAADGRITVRRGPKSVFIYTPA